MSIATAIELFNHPVLNPTKQLDVKKNSNIDPKKLNDDLHQHAIFGTSIESTIASHIHKTDSSSPQSDFNLSTSTNLWAHNEKLLTALNNINNRVLNGASININNSSFFRAIYHYLSQFNDTQTYDISIGLTIMKLLYNVSDMFPHTILYIIHSNIPRIILQILKSGLKSYNPDEFSLHIEYINVLEYISRYAYQHSVVIHNNSTSNTNDAIHDYSDDYYLHDTDAQTAKKVVSHFMDMTLNEENKSGIIDCILTNISLHDKKDVAKALSILAQIFACCLCHNSSCPKYLRIDPKTKQMNVMHQVQQGVQSLEQRLNEMQKKAKDTLLPDAFFPFQDKLNELKSQIDNELNRGNEGRDDDGLDSDDSDDDDDDDEGVEEEEYEMNMNRNHVSHESNVVKRGKILKQLANEVKMHSDYIVSILKHNFSEIEMVDSILCFLCNFTQNLLVHNAFDELMVVYNETFVKELMQFAIRCYSVIIQSQSRAHSMCMNQDDDEHKSEFESDEETTQISDVNNSRYCQFVVIILRILYQILCIKEEDVEDIKEKETKWKQIENIHNYLMYSCDIEKLYGDLVIVDKSNTNNTKSNIIRVNDTRLLETIVILGQTLNNKLQNAKKNIEDESKNNDTNIIQSDNNIMRNQLIHNLLCILVEYGRDIDSSSINLILHSLNMILTENLLIMAQYKRNHAFISTIYQQNNQKICELISFILEKNHEANHLNIVLLKHILQILLDWYDFTKMLKQNDKLIEMKHNLKKYGADLMINHWKKLLKERYPTYSDSIHSNNKEMEQIKNVMNIIRKSRRILDIEDMETDTDTDSESDTDLEEDEIQSDINKNNKKKKIKLLTLYDIDVMADSTYCDYISLNLNDLLLSTEITTADHLKKLGEMLLNMTRSDNRICDKLSNGSMSTAENNRLFVHKTAKHKHYKYWRLYSFYIQSILKDRDMFHHFRILSSIRCLLNENYLTKYQFIASGIIDILLYYLTVCDDIKPTKTFKRYKQSQKTKQKQKHVHKIKMDLLHDRQRLFAFVFFFDFDDKYLQMHLCDPSMYTKIIAYKNKASLHLNTNKKSQSIKYLVHLLLQCLNMDVFPVRTIRTRENNTHHTPSTPVQSRTKREHDDDDDITMHAKQFSFGAATKSQQIDKYYYELKLLSERVLMINVCHDIDNCVVAQSLHFSYKHQLHEWDERQKVKRNKQQEEKQQKKEEQVVERAEGMLEDEEDDDDDIEGNEEDDEESSAQNSDPFLFCNPLSSIMKDRHKQKIKLPTQTAASNWGTSFSSTFQADPAPYSPIRAVNFSVTGHLFMTIADITKVFITKYEALKKYKYKNPSQLLSGIAQNKMDKTETNMIDLSSFLIHHCSNPYVLSQFVEKDNNENDSKQKQEDVASVRASQLLQNGLELVVTYNGIEVPKHLTVLQVLLSFDYPHLFTDHISSSAHHASSTTFEDITESRHMDDEDSEFSFRSTYSKRDRHVFSIYFRWKQQNRTKATHPRSNYSSEQSNNATLLEDLINPTRYLDHISHRSESLLPIIPHHTHKTRSSSRRPTIASTDSLLLNSPPHSVDNRGKKRKFDKMEADSFIANYRPRKKRKITHYGTANTSMDYTKLYRDGTQTISITNAIDSSNTNTTNTASAKHIECDLSHQHFPEIPSKWNDALRDECVRVCHKSKWKRDGPTQIILKLLNYFHGFSSHWTTLYYDDFYDIENVFDFNKAFDINQVKMKYVYNDRNQNEHQEDDIQCLLKPHVFYNKELIERLKNQMEQSIVVISNTVNHWIKEIPLKYPFLFPYHIRKDVFDIFSFGPSRTFKNLVQFLKKCHHNSDAVHSENNPQRNAVSAHSVSIPAHSDRLRQTNILNIPSMSPLFHSNKSDESQAQRTTHKSASNHTFSMIHSLLTNENCMIPKETHKTVKMYRKNVLSDVCALFHSSKYFSPLLSYYQFQTFRYHTSDAMPSDTFRDELALHLLPDPERISSIAISRPRYMHRIPRNIDFNETNHNNSNNNNVSIREDAMTPTPPKKKKKTLHKNQFKLKKKQTANETQLQYLPILSEGIVDFNYDNDPFSTHFNESILRVQFYGDDGVGSGPTMEFFTLATNGLDRQDLQLWIDDDTHIESVQNATKTSNANINIQEAQNTSDSLYAFGVYRCTDCTLINSIVCCPHHPNTPLSCYKNQNERGNIGIQSVVDELFVCTQTDCDYHCHSDVNFKALKHTKCTYCNHKCDIYFWVISGQCIQRLNDAFPNNIHCISHPLMQCDCCKMISFPVSHDNNNELLFYSYGGVYDARGRSYPVHYLSSSRCFNQHCNPFCYRSDIHMIPILLHKSFVHTLYQQIVANKSISCLDLNHYQNIVCLSSGKSRKMRISGTKTFITGYQASKYKTKTSLVNFICSADCKEDKQEEQEPHTKHKNIVIRNHMSHVSGYNGLFYRPNILSFIRNTPLHNNMDKYLHVLGKIMILAMKENKRINVELHKMFFKMVLNANANSDINILDMLQIYPNDHYLMIFFRLFNIYLFYQNMSTYCAYFRESDSSQMDVEQEEDDDDDDEELTDSDDDYYSSKLITQLKEKCASFIDVLGLTLATPTLNISLSRHKQEGNEDEALSIHNLKEYLIGICNYFLNEGISKPNTCVQSGLESMIHEDVNDNHSLLLPFYDYEFELLIVGSNTQHFNEWTPKYLCKHVKLEQYASNAQVIKNLYDILCNEFDIKHKRQFIRFVTGSLSLPLGGLNKLNPRFTITKFTPSNQEYMQENGDCESLPHATTCRHTLRLPPYKTKTRLKAKLLQAMNHAQTGFYLS